MPLEESLNRILVGRPELKYYEAGLDLGWSSDPYESFRLFQGRILQEYDKIVGEFNLASKKLRLLIPSGDFLNKLSPADVEQIRKLYGP